MFYQKDESSDVSTPTTRRSSLRKRNDSKELSEGEEEESTPTSRLRSRRSKSDHHEDAEDERSEVEEEPEEKNNDVSARY